MTPRVRTRGLFITFEGGEGSGKTTQAKLLARWLREEKGLIVLLTREPGGGTEIGEQIHRLLHPQHVMEGFEQELQSAPSILSRYTRRILLSLDNIHLDPLVETLLYCADRREHVNVIRRSLMRNWVVVSDRFHDSTTAYQGYGHGIDLAFLERLHGEVVGDCLPDRTIYLDVEPEVGLRRARERNRRRRKTRSEGRFEAKRLEFHRRVREGYLALARREPHRILVVDGNQPLAVVQEEIRRAMESYLQQLRREEPRRLYKASRLEKPHGR